MGVAATDPRNVALYDTTTGQALGGPTFASEEQAEDFVAWAGPMLLGPNPTHYPLPAVLVALADEWQRTRLDEDGELREVEELPD